jgi:hypothetical protein
MTSSYISCARVGGKTTPVDEISRIQSDFPHDFIDSPMAQMFVFSETKVKRRNTG